MLERLLHEIQSGSVVSATLLAKRLNTSSAMVEVMLDELVRRGLLTEVDLSYSRICGSCQLASQCGSCNLGGRMWKVSAKKTSANR